MKTTTTSELIYESPCLEIFLMTTGPMCEFASNGGGEASGGTDGDVIEECSFLIP